MYAIVDIAGQQFKAEKARKIYVHRLEAEEGARIEFPKVLLLDKEGDVSVGKPIVEGTVVAARVVSHLRGDKVLVFKKKRRKGYKKLNGHRQDLTQIEVLGILQNGVSLTGEEAAPKAKVEKPVVEAKPKAVKAPKAEIKKETKKVAETAPKAKKAAEKKAPAAEKKPAVKKSAAPKKSTKKSEE